MTGNETHTDKADFTQEVSGNYVLKVAWEVVNTPLTYRVVNYLKRAEREDYYDWETDFTPFSITA